VDSLKHDADLFTKALEQVIEVAEITPAFISSEWKQFNRKFCMYILDDSVSDNVEQICTCLSTFFTRKDQLLRKNKDESIFLGDSLFRMMNKWNGDIPDGILNCSESEEETEFITIGTETISKIFE